MQEVFRFNYTKQNFIYKIEACSLDVANLFEQPSPAYKLFNRLSSNVNILILLSGSSIFLIAQVETIWLNIKQLSPFDRVLNHW